ncbi:MAG: methyltransferase domain-containing protein [Firmicutes bacterium]|nr:methyltransferase domain-containing protein [Bacillota bacterium]
MKAISKKDRARSLIAANLELFQCPVCGGAVGLEQYSLKCDRNHTFDLARKGYLNLLTDHKAPAYDLSLFAARQQVAAACFFDPLILKLAEIIRDHSQQILELRILDAGCGEGSHLFRLHQVLNQPALCVGVDIAKGGINLAASRTADILWCVADLAQLPFQKGSFDVVLNILAPANYGEFTRIAAEPGLIIKVVPGPKYLQELRHQRQGEAYSNQEVVEHFQERLKLIATEEVNYSFTATQDLWPHLVAMTPLTWSQDQTRLLQAVQDQERVTVDLTILVGRNF